MRGDLPSCSRILSTIHPNLCHTQASTTRSWTPNSTRCLPKCNATWDTCLDKSRNECGVRRIGELGAANTRLDPRSGWTEAYRHSFKTQFPRIMSRWNSISNTPITSSRQIDSRLSGHEVQETQSLSDAKPSTANRFTSVNYIKGSHQTPVCLFPYVQTITVLLGPKASLIKVLEALFARLVTCRKIFSRPVKSPSGTNRQLHQLQ